MLVGQIGAAVLALASAPVLARALGPDGRGFVAAGSAAASIAPLLISFGIPMYLRRLSAHHLGKRLSALTFVPTTAQVPLAAALAVAGSLLLFAGASKVIVLTCFAAIVTAPLAFVWACDLSILIANRMFLQVMTLQLVPPGLILIVAGYLLVAGLDSPALVLGTIPASNLLCVLLTRRFTRRAVLASGTLRPTARECVAGGFGYYAGAVADMASMRVGLVLCLPMAGALEAGFLSIAMTATALSVVVGQTMSAALFSRAALADRIETRRIAEGAAQQIVAVASVVAGLGAAAAPLVVPFAFGEDFRAAVVPTIVALLGSTLLNLALVQSSILNARGDARFVSRTQLVGLIVQVLAVVLLSQFGALGFAGAFGLGYALMCCAYVARARIRLRFLLPTPASMRLGLALLLRR